MRRIRQMPGAVAAPAGMAVVMVSWVPLLVVRGPVLAVLACFALIMAGTAVMVLGGSEGR